MKALPSLLLLLVVLTGIAPETAAQRKRTAPKKPSVTVSVVGLATADVQRRVDSFEKVWQTIAMYYFDATFGGLDWDRIRKEYEPRIRRTKTDAQAHAIIEEMIGRLKVSHLAIVPPDVYEAIESAKAKAKERRDEQARLESPDADPDTEEIRDNEDESYGHYGIGVDVRFIGDRFVVSRVDPFSTARLAGIKPGFVIDSINGVSLISLIGRVRLAYPKNERVLNYLPIEIVSEILNSPDPEPITIGYRDANEELHTVSIDRERLPSLAVSLGNNFPERQLLFERRALSDDIGYVRFNNFSLPVIEKFCEALEVFESKKALVIDLRGNVGGVLSVSSTLAGMLSDRPFRLGTSIYRFGSETMESTPKAKNYKGTVVVLIDELSMSAAEMFAAALQESKRAFIIGERSAGETLPAVSVELPTGATFLYPIANFKTPTGRFLEGTGVMPDKVVTLERATLLTGADPQLDAAIKNAELLSSVKEAVPPETPAKAPESISVKGSGTPPPPPPPAARTSIGNGVPLKGTELKAPVIEEKAREIMEQFAEKIGRTALVSKLESYEMSGEVVISRMGSTNRFDYQIFRSGKEKYAEVLTSPATGEIKDIRNGKTMHLKGDLGMDRVVPFPVAVDQSDILAILKYGFRVEDFKTLRYLGEYELEGRKVHLIDGETMTGGSVALTYHSGSLLLAGYEGPSGGMKFDDYRKIGEMMLPHRIYNRVGLDITFDEIKINTKIDPAVFEHRDRCYDRKGDK